MTRIRIIAAGPGVTLQDGGRHGYLRYGVTGAGPMDPLAHATANLAVGNPRDATAIETSVAGLALTCLNAALDVAMAGGDFIITRDGTQVPATCRLNLKPGEVLQIAAGKAGSWCYLALAGAIDLPQVLGSHATHIRSGFGGINGRALQPDDEIALRDSRSFDQPEGTVLAPWLDRASDSIRVLAGPQRDHFSDPTFQDFLAGPWTVTPRGDRMALFLDGPPLHHAKGYNIVSDGVAMGAVQVPGTGQPIILMADRQPTGGYPKIANVIGADLGLLAQLRPGARFSFVQVSHDQAVAALRGQEQAQTAGITTQPLVRHRFCAGLPDLRDPAVPPDPGALTAGDCFALLFDAGHAFLPQPGMGKTAEGRVFGRQVLAFSGDAPAAEIAAWQDRARAEHLPLIGLLGGGDTSPRRMAAIPGPAPFIALVLGRTTGLAALAAAGADLCLTVQDAGRPVLCSAELAHRVTGEYTDAADLGMAEAVSSAHYPDELAAFQGLRRLLDLLPDATCAASTDPAHRASPALRRLTDIPDHDIRDLLTTIADHGEFFALKPDDARTMVTGLMRLGGRSCGVMANQPAVNGGALDAGALWKAADFARLCKRLGLPLLRVIDTPGLLPGKAQAQAGALRAGAVLMRHANQPGACLILRSPADAAAMLMGADLGPCLVWPCAKSAAVSSQGVEIDPQDTRSRLIAALSDQGDAPACSQKS